MPVNIAFPNRVTYYYESKPENDYFLIGSQRGQDQQRLSYTDISRFYKGAYRGSKDRLMKVFREYAEHANRGINTILEMFDEVEPFTYKEAFEIKDRGFRALVFGTIDIPQMIKYLGSERIEVDGKEVRTKVFKPDPDGKYHFDGYEDKHNIFETHRIYGEKLGARDFYAVKCWCTSTNQEHWVYIEEKYANDPLNAIASTFRVPEDIIPYIKEIKRQGDVLLLEMKEDVKPGKNAKAVPLDKDTYFKLLTCET